MPLVRFLKRLRRNVKKQSHYVLRRAAAGLCYGAVVFALAMALVQPACAEVAGSRPNIIFVLADDMGWGDAGFNRQQWIKTPVMDQMAREGCVFTRHYAGAPLCTATRCCLLTGMHNGHARLQTNTPSDQTLLPEDITVAELLQGAGYSTHFMGKWGMGGAHPTPDWVELGFYEGPTASLIDGVEYGLPTRQGFDTSLAFLCQWTAHQHYPQYLWRGEELMPLPGNYGKPYARYQERTDYAHDFFTQDALEIVREADGAKPFYIQLSYTVPHKQNLIPRGHTDNPYYPYDDETDWTGIEPTLADKGYAAMISLLDHDMGRIKQAVLDNPAIADNTLIICTSDNGPQETQDFDMDSKHTAEMFDSNGHLREIKFYIYEGGIREPFVAWWPGRIPAGRVSDHVGHFADFLPTACELAGITAPLGIDGVSYLPALTGAGEQQQHDHLVWTMPGAVDRPAEAVLEVDQSDGHQWKLLTGPMGDELFDLAIDEGERNNVAESRPEVVKRLREVLKRENTGPKAATMPF